MRMLLIVVLCLICAQQTMGQATINVAPDRNEADFLDLIRVSIVVEAPSDFEIDWQDTDALFGKFSAEKVGEQADIPVLQSSDRGRRRWTRLYEFSAGEIGDLQIPAIAVGVRPTDAKEPKWKTILSAPQTIVINSVLTDEDAVSNIRPLKKKLPIESVKPSGSDFVVLATGAAILLATLLLFIWKRSRRPLDVTPYALARLKEIENSETNDESLYHEFAKVFCEWTASMSGHSPTGATTRDALTALRSNPSISADEIDPIEDFLVRVDQSRFSRTGLSVNEPIETIIPALRDFILKHQHKLADYKDAEGLSV